MIIIKSIFLCFTIWVLTALLNALLGGTCLYFFSDEFWFWQAAVLDVLFFTLFLSVPGIFIFWLGLLVNRKKALLFRQLLKAGLIISALSSLLLFVLPFNDFKGQQFYLAVCIVVSAITSVMMHHTRIQKFSTNQINEEYA